MENNKQTAVEWLAEKYNYITWLRNRDEISANTADEWRAEFLEQAKEMEHQQQEDAYINGGKSAFNAVQKRDFKTFEDYYDETYGNKAADT